MANAPKTVYVTIQGMSGDRCAETVQRALEAVPGVESAAVDLHQARARVILDPAQADESRLKSAIESAGFTVPD